jgi:hypothetical protein
LILRPVGGETLCHGDKEPKPILHVLQFCVANQPGPIQVWVRQQDPRKSLRQPGLEVLSQKCRQDYRSGIGLSGTQVCEAGVAEPGELAGEEGVVRLGILG